jgi:hypothetical protein
MLSQRRHPVEVKGESTSEPPAAVGTVVGNRLGREPSDEAFGGFL